MLGGLAAGPQVILYFVLGAVGSLLPDMDSDKSVPLRFAFTLASILLAFACMFLLCDVFPSVAELVLIWVACFLSVRWLVFYLLGVLTDHRGLFHSVPAALLAGLLTCAAFHHGLDFPPLDAWLSGLFVCFGYLVHLLLDELYSVNLFGYRPRRSLGTALKLLRRDRPLTSLLLYAALPLAFVASPSSEPFLDVALDPAVYRQMQHRLLPEGPWFVHRRAGQPAPQGVRITVQAGGHSRAGS
jgi:membrane-bound metal-dependent hydrolase YbcI (DUF457 family)